MKIAIFGGAFNPVHREHVNLARAAVEELKLDKIIITPTAVSPHKSGRLSADFGQRFTMCRQAFSKIPQAEVNDYEFAQGGISYTYLTCEHFARLYAEADRYLIIGADMLCEFPEWKNPQKILKDFTLAACARENSSSFKLYKDRVEGLFKTEVKTIPYVGEKVSSTQVRTLAALGEDFSGLVDCGVHEYIEQNGIYAVGGLHKAKDMMKEERWQHTLRVAYMCAKNASRADITELQAFTMSALHDCAKYLEPDDDRLRGCILPQGVPRPVVHQYTGAYVAEHAFGVRDKTVLSAIGCHATGKPGMSRADMLLYLSDMLEEGRDFNGVEKLRESFATQSLEECMLKALEHQLRYLNSMGAEIDKTTYSAYVWLKEKLSE